MTTLYVREVKVSIRQTCTGFSMSIARVPSSECAGASDDLALDFAR